MRACVRMSLAPAWCVRTSNFYTQYSTSKHEPALCSWNAKNGEKNPDNVPERRAHRVTHTTRGGGGNGGRAGPTVTAAYGVIPPPRATDRCSVYAPIGQCARRPGISVARWRHTACSRHWCRRVAKRTLPSKWRIKCFVQTVDEMQIFPNPLDRPRRQRHISRVFPEVFPPVLPLDNN